MEKVQVGVVGCGYWGPKLIRNLVENGNTQVKYVSDLNQDKLASMKNRYPHVKTTDDYRLLLKDPDLEAVAIATPVSTHHQIAREALESGKHVLIEKPLASSARQAAELVELSEKNGLVLLVDHIFLYTEGVRKIASMIAKGEIGDLYYFDSVRINLGLIQHDINVIWDLAPHDFSIMDYLVSEKPKRLSATGASPAGSGQEEIAYVSLHFPNNMIAHFHFNWMSPVKIRSIIIGGGKKMIVYDDLNTLNKVQVYDKGVEISKSDYRSYYHQLFQYRIGDMYAPHIDNTEALQTLVRHFVECIREKCPPLTGGESGLQVVRLLEAADRSLKKGGRLSTYE